MNSASTRWDGSGPRPAGLRRRFTAPGIGVLVALVVLALAVAGCGSEDSTDTAAADGTTPAEATPAEVASEAQERVDQVSGPVEFTFGESVDASEAKGKRIFIFEPSDNFPFVEILNEGSREAAAAAGVKLDFGTSNGDVAKGAQVIEEAVERGYDAIVISTFEPSLVANASKAAKAAGIPIISQFTTNPELPTPEYEELGVFGNVAFPISDEGALVADYIIADSGAEASTVFIGSSDSEASNIILGGAESQFDEVCTSCEFKVNDVLVSDWATRLGPVAGTSLQNPSVDYLFPVFGDMATFMTSEINKAGRPIGVGTLSANDSQLKEMQAGKGVITASVGQPVNWAGWATIDQALRAVVGADPVADEEIPVRLFTDKNIGEIDLSKPEDTWYGPVDHRAEYMELWGLS